MRYTLFGMDAREPEGCARMLREKGYSGVTIGRAEPRVVEALAENGLTYDLSAGAFSLGGGFSRLAQDCEGRQWRWFSSGCPSDEAMRRARLAHYEELAAAPGVRAVMLDGARFASFASGEGRDAFFTCFCPTCMRAAEELGFDPERMLRGARAFYRFTQTGEGDAQEAISGIGEWLAFREASASAFLTDFARVVHRQGKKAGAFVFAPSLARWVGQAKAGECGLDILSPMIYRRYPYDEGPACLNHEWAGLLDLMTGKTGLTREKAARLLHAPELPEDVLRDGFPCAQVGIETASLNRAGRRYLLAPILQLEDGEVLECLRAARAAGADELSLFAYQSNESTPDLRALKEEEA